MTGVLDKTICLSLNRSWRPIGMLTVGEAVIAMAGGLSGGHPAFGMDVDFMRREDGSLDMGQLTNASPVPWEDWIQLPVREHDLAIATVNGGIRAPTVIIQQNYDKIPMKRPRLCRRGIWERDQGVCQYTGRRLKPSEGNIDHVLPRDLGGRDTWENLVLSHVEINSRKGNRLNREAGLQLLRAPKAPPSVPMTFAIREAKHPHWTPFLMT
jgi:5-methylcytosine-specific restriction endonuclease McrA